MKTASLKDVCQISMGQAPDGSSYNDIGEGFPLIAGAGDFGALSPKPKKFTREPSKISEVDDIILCIRATIGDLNWSDKAYCLGRGVAGLRPRADKLDRHYLWHWLASQKEFLFSQGTGSTFKQISRSIIDKLSIPLPPLHEQKRIAAILDKADSIRRKRQEAVRLTEELLRSVFLDMFGDPVTNPKEWEIKPLSDEIEFLTSGSRGWAEFYSDSGRKFIRIQNVKNGLLHFNDVQYVTPPENKEAARTKVQENDLLISITADLGRTAVVDKITAKEGAHINQHLALVRLSKAFNPHFVAAYLESEGGKRQFLQLDQTAVKSGLNFDSIKSLHLFNPPLQMQNRYASFVHALERAKGKLRTSSEVTDNLFDSLLQRAFTGEM
jgi:type I restriction enzyme S subunit